MDKKEKKANKAQFYRVRDEIKKNSTFSGPQATFMRYCENGNMDGVKSLLPQIDINFKNNWSFLYNGWATPLHYACRSGHLDVVKLLLNHGANINCQDVEFWTPLFYSCFNGHEDIALFLLERGIDPSVKCSWFERTAMDYAKYRKFDSLVEKIEKFCGITAQEPDRSKKSETKSLITKSLFLKVYKFKNLENAEHQVQEWRSKNLNGETLPEKLLLDAYDENIQEDVTIQFLFDYSEYLKQTREILLQKEQGISKGFYRASCVETGEFVIITPK